MPKGLCGVGTVQPLVNHPLIPSELGISRFLPFHPQLKPETTASGSLRLKFLYKTKGCDSIWMDLHPENS